MSNNKVWLVIEKTNYGENNDSFSISKTADTIEQATKFKVHLDALNDRKNRTYFLVSDISTVLENIWRHYFAGQDFVNRKEHFSKF